MAPAGRAERGPAEGRSRAPGVARRPLRGPCRSVQLLHGLVDVDLAAGQALQQLVAAGRLGARRRDAQLAEEGVEPGPRRRVADAQVALELAHVAPRDEEHPERLPVLTAQRAELARRELPRELGAAGAAAQPGEGEAVTADGTVAGR